MGETKNCFSHLFVSTKYLYTNCLALPLTNEVLVKYFSLHYWLGSGVAVLESKEYEYSGLYAGNRLLENEEWHTWTFSPINNAEKNILPIPRLLKAAPNN